MQINPPFGYSEIVPLYKNQKVRLPAPGALPEFCRKVNAVPISYSEFAVACRDYPLAFITTDQSKTFLPVAVLGVTGGENLFLRDGQWDGSVYLPAYVRRYPFCMARVTLDSVEQADRLICVEKAFVSEEGERMFDDSGLALARWQPIEKLLQEYEADLERRRERHFGAGVRCRSAFVSGNVVGDDGKTHYEYRQRGYHKPDHYSFSNFSKRLIAARFTQTPTMVTTVTATKPDTTRTLGTLA